MTSLGAMCSAATSRRTVRGPLLPLLTAVAAVMAILMLTVACSSRSELAAAPVVDLGELPTSDGATFDFASVAGEPTVVWFWGPG